VIKLYDRSTIDQLPWPNTPDGQYAKDYLFPLIKEGTHKFIDNVQTNLQALTIDDLVLPITINDAEYENSYVCSPYCQYVSYAIDELYLLKNTTLQCSVKAILLGLGRLLKCVQINRVVIVNNWLLSTNLYPRIKPQQIRAITDFLTKRFPNHLIMWRSLNHFLHSSIIETMKSTGYRDIAENGLYVQSDRRTSDKKT